MQDVKTYQYVNCNRPETEIPLVSLRYSGSQVWICSQCFPLLIHHPAQLAGKLTGAEKFEPTPHHH